MKYVLAVLAMCLCLAGCWTPPTTSNVLDEYQGGLDDWTVGLDYKLWENVTSRVEYLSLDAELDGTELRILSLLPNPKGKDAGNEQVTLVNTSKKAVSLRGWSLRDKEKNVYGLSGSIAANGRRVITMKSNSMPLNNDGDTIMLVQGNTSRHTVSYTKKQAGNGAVVKVGK